MQAAHVAFVINELRRPPVTNVVRPNQRQLLETHHDSGCAAACPPGR
jgi:hypothetical protein